MVKRSYCVVCLALLCLLFLPRLVWSATPEYDRGEKGGVRLFKTVIACRERPCIITQWGAIRFQKGFGRTHRIELGALHRGQFSSIAFFQESSSLEQKLSERVFNKKPNRKVVNLERLIETDKTDTLYMYGVLLQHDLDEGDLLVLRLTHWNNPKRTEEYFFRFHQQGARWDIDIAFIQPINIFTPNPGDVIQAAYSTAAVSFSVGGTMDPERKYSIPGRLVRAIRFNLFTGFLLRRDIGTVAGDRITKDHFDGFGGVGATFFDFFAVGYGVNFIRSPHTTFPFVGLELRHFLEFLRSLKKDTHTRWEKYLHQEQEREKGL